MGMSFYPSGSDLDPVLHHVEEDVGGGALRIMPRDLLHPGVVAVVPLTTLTVHHLTNKYTRVMFARIKVDGKLTRYSARHRGSHYDAISHRADR